MTKVVTDRILTNEEVSKLSMTDLISYIDKWVHDRNLHTAEPKSQFVKVVEELGELAGGLARGNEEVIKDSVGDIIVTLVSTCATLGIDITDCTQGAYNEIKHRKGKLIDGVFIKEEDL